MDFSGLNVVNKLAGLLVSPGLDPEHKAQRIQSLQRDIVFPVKAAVIVIFAYFFATWQTDSRNSREVALETIRSFFTGYVLINVFFGAVLHRFKKLPLGLLEWSVFTLALLDGILIASLTIVTGGFDSIVYWLFLALIIQNAVTIPFDTPQIVANLAVSFFYVVAGLIDVAVSNEERIMLERIDLATRRALDIGQIENPTEPFLLRIIVLLLMVACCYGLQVLFEKQRLAAEEAAEFNSRQEQLQAAGRLAAEIAHQIKNPLAIITNAAYSLERAVSQGKKSVDEQIAIIREEVERANRIVTELMGYAQLSEGRVERMNVIDEVELAINQVFPPGATYEIAIRRNFDQTIPGVLMQKGHLSEILVNLLQNAREAMNGRGVIEVSTRYGENYSVLVGISDNGPGIPPDKLERIFDAYFTTKEQGTGLGLAIVKHNVELYGGSLTVESVLGQGTHFIIKLPGKSVLKITR